VQGHDLLSIEEAEFEELGFVVKLFWPSDKRRAEGDLLRLAGDRNMWGASLNSLVTRISKASPIYVKEWNLGNHERSGCHGKLIQREPVRNQRLVEWAKYQPTSSIVLFIWTKTKATRGEHFNAGKAIKVREQP
jgi:hypothetical protein